MNSIKISAPAKINLHLQITSKRTDGYHNLVTLFQMVSLYDELEIKVSHEESIDITGRFDCAAEDNLIYKAAGIIKRNYGIKHGFKIKCRKNIPPGGGLGGGSSNAAATLLGINLLLDLKIPVPELMSYALELGSDVPFFLGSPAATAHGRGEVLTPIEGREDLSLLLIETSIHSSTGDAFKSLDTEEDIASIPEKRLKEIYLSKIPSEWPFFNSFTPYLFRQYPVFREMIKILNDNGSEFSAITGTGSSVFGVYSNSKLAEISYNSLKKLNIRVHKLKMLANRPMAVYNYPIA